MPKKNNWHYFNELIAKTNAISFADATPSFKVTSKYFEIFKDEMEILFDKVGPKIFDYADIKGDELLRKELILKNLAGENTTENMVLITNGGQEAIKLVIETILKKGEKVMTERLSYVGLEQTVLSNNGKIVCFSNNLNKLKLSEIEQELRKNKPKLVYLIPDFSNPCGDNLKNNIRELIIKLALELSFWVIEDQTYRELYFDKSEQLASMFSKSDKVIIVGSISKIIVPGLRIGWVVTKNNLLRKKIITLKESSTLSTNNLSQKLVAQLLEKKYEKIINWTRNYYDKKMKIALKRLEEKMPKEFIWTKPKGGFCIWIEGPKTFKAKKTLDLALGNGVGYIPGEVFYYDNKELNTFRLSISAIKKSEIIKGIDRLSATLCNKKPTISIISNLRHHLLPSFDR